MWNICIDEAAIAGNSMVIRVSIWLVATILLLTGMAIAASPADRLSSTSVTKESPLLNEGPSDGSNCADLHMGQSFDGDEVRSPPQEGCSQGVVKPE